MLSAAFALSALSTLLIALAPSTSAADATQLRLLNNFRTANGVPALVELSALDSCAYAHSVDMSNNGELSHYGSDGSTSATRIYRCVGASITGENVANGYQYVQNVFAAWQNSAAHRANMLNPDFNVVGFGSYNQYWTQNFAYVAGVKAPTTTTTTTRRTTTTTSQARTSTTGSAAATSEAAVSESPSATQSAAEGEEAEPTYIPPETGVLLDVDSDSYIVPVSDSSSTNGTTYDDSDGNASIYEGDEERLASKSSLLMAKMDAAAYQVYLSSKNTSVMNPFLVVSFESAAVRRSIGAEFIGLGLAVAVAAMGAVFAI